MNKDLINKSSEYLFTFGILSIPFLQMKLNISYSQAKEIIEYFKQPI
jgi:hypothetical protein